MKVQALGEEAYLIRDTGLADPFGFSKRLTSFPGVVEAVSAYDTVAAYVDRSVFNIDNFIPFIESCLTGVEANERRLHEIPVCYELGLDFVDTCQKLEMSASELVKLHTSVEYRCHAIGFSPGFPYLAYLPGKLSGLSRLPSPRVRVPAGSVGITGNQTGIYPQETPGGWHLIGRTPLIIASLSDAYFPISAGDAIRFLPISADEYAKLEGERL